MNSVVLSPLRIDSQYLNNSQAITKICGREIHNNPNTVVEFSNLRKKDIKTTMTLVAVNDGSIINMFDVAVMDSVYTLKKHDFDIVTPDMIAHVLYGNQSISITEEKITHIKNSVEKLMGIGVIIDCIAEMQARHIEIESQLSGRMLPMEVVDETVIMPNHRKADISYMIKETPVIYRYAELIKQVISVDPELIGIEGHSCTERAILIQRYILKRIMQLKNQHTRPKKYGRKMNNKISYMRKDHTTGADAGLFTAIGINRETYENDRKTRGDVHKTIVSIADSFVAKGIISGYTVDYGPYRRPEGITLDMG